MLLGFSADSEVSMRNLSAQATSGRNTKKLAPTTRITMVTMATTTFEYEPSAAAAPMKLPMPGRLSVRPFPPTNTVTASEAVRKNHPPPIDIIMFQTRPIMELGTSSFQNLCHLVNRYIRAASSSSVGCESKEW